MSIDNIRSIVPEQNITDAPPWRVGTKYRRGDLSSAYIEGQQIKRNFRALKENVGIAPYQNRDTWEWYDGLSEYLKDLTARGIATMVQTFVQMKNLQQETRNLLERRTFFDGAGRLNATIVNRGRLVGFEIVPFRAMGVTTKIERVGLQMTGGTGSVRLYLFHSSQVDPVKTVDVEFTQTNGGFQWFTLDDVYLPYISESNDAGGAWYLCYNQNDLPEGMQAINVARDFSREPCGTCNYGNLAAWRELTKYIQISPFCTSALKTFKDYPEMWDIADNAYTNTVNYGMNVEVTVGCDLTDFIIEQKQIFANVLQKQVAAIALRTMALNPDVRVNRNQSNISRQQILYELDGDSRGKDFGLGTDLKDAYRALSLDTRGLDRICLSCHNGGVKYRTV